MRYGLQWASPGVLITSCYACMSTAAAAAGTTRVCNDVQVFMGVRAGVNDSPLQQQGIKALEVELNVRTMLWC